MAISFHNHVFCSALPDMIDTAGRALTANNQTILPLPLVIEQISNRSVLPMVIDQQNPNLFAFANSQWSTKTFHWQSDTLLCGFGTGNLALAIPD